MRDSTGTPAGPNVPLHSSEPDIKAWLRLALTPDVSPAMAHELLRSLGSPEAIFGASENQIQAIDAFASDEHAGKRIRRALSGGGKAAAVKTLDLAQRHGVGLITYGSAAYPRALRDLANPPLVLYIRGKLIKEDRLSISIVGPRKASDYARLMTQRLVPPLCARGLTIVSGLAYGIDAEAHVAALECEGRTIAVLGQGLDTPVYPAANQRLAQRIERERLGAIVSVFPFGVDPLPGLFPQRNEVIAALSLGTLIVEASEKSGALITATHAAELGRTVMACPGDASRSNARGSNRLIAEGAAMVQKSDDVLETLAEELRAARNELVQDTRTEYADIDPDTEADRPGDPDRQESAASETVTLPSDPIERRIRELLADEHRPIDFVLEGCADMGYSQSAVIQALLKMEMSGRVRQLPGKIYAWVS